MTSPSGAPTGSDSFREFINSMPVGTTVTITREHPPVAPQMTCLHGIGHCGCKPQVTHTTERYVTSFVPVYEYPHAALFAAIGFFLSGIVGLYTLLAWQIGNVYIYANGSQIVTNTLADNGGWLTILTLLLAVAGGLAGYFLGSTRAFSRNVDYVLIDHLVSPERAAELRRLADARP